MTKKVSKKKVAKKASKKAAKKTAKKVVKKASKKVAKKAAKKPATKSAKPAALKLGELAPGFTLQDQDGKSVSLSDYRGRYVVVYFYPRAMTPGCTTQACGLRDKKTDLASQGIVVLGISPDKPASLKKFQQRDQLNFTLLSDLDHQVAEAYGSWGQKQFMGRTFDGILRQSFLLDKEGRLLHVINKVDTKTHAEDVLGFYGKL